MSKPADTLEKIVADAIERERIINEQHPERHGYGMIQGEANDLIHRIEHLEINQLRAQGVKVKNRTDKIRLIGKDMLYSRSPEEIAIDNIDKEEIAKAEAEVIKRLSKRCRNVYFLREIGMSQSEIGEMVGVNKSTVCRDLKKANTLLKDTLEFVYKENKDNYVFLRTPPRL